MAVAALTVAILALVAAFSAWYARDVTRTERDRRLEERVPEITPRLRQCVSGMPGPYSARPLLGKGRRVGVRASRSELFRQVPLGCARQSGALFVLWRFPVEHDRHIRAPKGPPGSHLTARQMGLRKNRERGRSPASLSFRLRRVAERSPRPELASDGVEGSSGSKVAPEKKAHLSVRRCHHEPTRPARRRQESERRTIL